MALGVEDLVLRREEDGVLQSEEGVRTQGDLGTTSSWKADRQRLVSSREGLMKREAGGRGTYPSRAGG